MAKHNAGTDKLYNVFDDGVGVFSADVSKDVAERVFVQLVSNGSYDVELVEYDTEYDDYRTIQRA